MIEIVENLVFKSYGKKSTVVRDMFIKVDEENRVLLVNDIVDAAYIDISKKSILRRVNSDVAKMIETKLNITLAEYGVKVSDDILEVPCGGGRLKLYSFMMNWSIYKTLGLFNARRKNV